MTTFLALITPLDSGLGTWGGVAPPMPSHPIAPGGGGGVGIWPSPGHPAHPIAPGGSPPGIWPSPGVPTHPIAPGGPPLGIWGGAPPYPDQGLPPSGVGIWPSPGHPAHPIAPGGQPPGPSQGPGFPTPPIYLPPGTLPGHPEHPIFIPPSVNIPNFPTHPIVLPPPGSGDKPQVLENWDVKTAWSPQSGWVVAIVPSEEHPGTPTPSA